MSELLSFSLGEEVYAVDILSVQEIKTFEGATRLPHTPAYVKGVMNLRGEIVPVHDLRARLGMDSDYGRRPVVIVFRLAQGRIAGGLVDAVCDVHPLGEVQAAPTTVSPFVTGLVTVGDVMLIMLDLERLFEEEA